jgi:hypothetical protein
LQLLARYVRIIEDRFRPVWHQDLPVSDMVVPWPDDLDMAIRACRAALGAGGEPLPVAATTALFDAWHQIAGDDPMLAFVVVTMGAQWGEPALRSALREALWHQPDLYNGDTRFCWSAGGPEGETRRRVWQQVMSLGATAARAARAARSSRHQWYDGLLLLREPPASFGTGPLVLASN